MRIQETKSPGGCQGCVEEDVTRKDGNIYE